MTNLPRTARMPSQVGSGERGGRSANNVDDKTSSKKSVPPKRKTRTLIFVLAKESWCICLLRFKRRTGNSHDLSTALVYGSSTGGLSDR